MSSFLTKLNKNQRDSLLKQIGLAEYLGKPNSEIKEAATELLKHRLKTKEEMVKSKKESSKLSDKDRISLHLEVMDIKIEKLNELLTIVSKA